METKPTYGTLAKRFQETMYTVIQKKKSVKKNLRFKKMLDFFSMINELIAMGTEKIPLLEQVCSKMIQFLGYHHAWIVLPVTADHEVLKIISSMEDNVLLVPEFFDRMDLPNCIRRAMGQDNLVIVRNPIVECPDCPFSFNYTGGVGFTRQLTVKGDILGILFVSIPEAWADDDRERAFFNTLADHLAFFILNCNVEKQLQRFNSIINGIPHPMFLIASDYRYLAFNVHYAELYGINPTHILGRTPADLFGLEFFETQLKPYLDQCLSGEEISRQAYMGQPVKGQRWMEMKYFPYHDEKGRISGVIFYGIDIREQKRHEQVLASRLRLSESLAVLSEDELLRKSLDEAELLTDSSVGFFHFLEPDQNTVSRQMWSTNTLQRMCSAKSNGPHSTVDHAGVWVDCVRQRRPVIHNDYKNLPHRKGLPAGHAPVIRMLTIPVVRDEQIVAILGVGNKKTNYNHNDIKVVSDFSEVIWDIILRKRAEVELQKSENGLRAAQRIAQLGSWELDLKTNVLVWSDEVFRIFEIQPSEFGATVEAFLERVHPEDRQWLEQTYRLSIENQKDYAVDHRLLMKDGRIKYVHEECKTLYEDNGNPIRSIGTVHDITEQKKMEAKQVEYERRIQQAQKMEAIGTLAGGVAHDFNNILFSLMGYAELLREDIAPDDPCQAYIDEILHAACRSRDLVKQILTFSRQSEREAKPMRLQPVIKEALKLLRASIPTTIEFRQDIDSDGFVVNADPTQVHQIMMNLVTNAYHAMENDKGVLTVSLTQVELESESPSFLELVSGPYALLKVIDTGVGIHKEIIDRVFDPYFTTKNKEKGTGLGLAVVQGIVKSCKGDIRIYSEPEKGTEVHVYLPIIKRNHMQNNTQESVPVAGGTESILLVDDEEAIVHMERSMLERFGYKVTTFTGSVEAFNAFEESPDFFDLIVTDMTMPNMTGVQLAGKIKNIKPTIPIILCTGFSYQIDEEKCRAYGIEGFVMKPVIGSDIAKAIRKALDESPCS